MKILLSAVFALALPFAGQAGLVIVESLEQTGAMALNTKVTIKVEGDGIRMDTGREMSVIVNAKNGEITSLMHPQKLAMQLPKGALDAIKQKTADQKSMEKPNLKPTGKKETINGFHCEEYAGAYQGLQVSYWVTSDIKNADRILAQLGTLSGDADPFKGALANGADFPGFPIRTVVTSPQSGKSTMTIESVKEEAVPASEFVVPSDYKKMALPQMQGGGMPGGN